REGISGERIHYVGNVMIDPLFRFREKASASPALEELALRPRHFAVLTLHRPSNVDDPAKLGRTLAAVAAVRRDVPIIFPVHPRTRQRLQQLEPAEMSDETLRLIEPAAYLYFVHLMANAACVPTFSRGF